MGRQRWLGVVALIGAGLPGAAHAESALSMYGDIDGGVKTDGTRTGTADTFSAAKLDLFATTTVDRWSFLAETMFEAGDENTFSLDVERVQIAYLHAEWLRVMVGRFHTALGYYNDAFHHGTYFMVPTDRPRMVEFEDGGGLLPAHNIGLHADGRFAFGDDHVRYDFEVANGRGADPLAIQNNHDTNRPKAFNLRLRWEPGGDLEGLIVGGNAYFDAIPGGEGLAASGMTTLGPVHEWIFGAHVAYFEHDLHLVAEALAVQHTETQTGTSHRTYGAFAEAGHAFDKVTPYARYEWTRFPSEGDPYYRATSADGYQAVSAGVKHSTNDNIALKVQAGVLFPRTRGADPVYSLTSQVAFAF